MRKLHVAWFIGWWCLGLIIGTGLCVVTPPIWFADSFWLLVSISICLLCIKRQIWMLGLACLAGGIIGLWRGSELKQDLQVYKPYYGQVLTVRGLVSQDASYGDRGDQRLNLSNVSIEGIALSGDIWIRAVKKDVKRGDIITVKGTLNQGFGNLSASMYRAEIIEVIRPSPGDIARRVRDWFGEGVRRAIPEPQVSLGLGYLVGQKTALPPDLENQIKITGLTHVVVASGYNLTILVMFSRKLFSRISKFSAAFASSLMVISFMLITGLSPSASRAGLVAGIGLLVWYYGRKMHPFVLLSFAAAVTVLINPSYVWGDLGWYLSFLAFIGVIVLAPLVQHYFWGKGENTPMLRQLLVDTSSAQIATGPIIFLSFGLLSLYALPANMLVLPFVPLAMLCTFIAGIFGLLLPGLATFFGLPATLLLAYSTKTIEFFANLPNAQNELKFNPLVMTFSYIGIGALITYLKWGTKHDFRDDSTENY